MKTKIVVLQDKSRMLANVFKLLVFITAALNILVGSSHVPALVTQLYSLVLKLMFLYTLGMLMYVYTCIRNNKMQVIDIILIVTIIWQVLSTLVNGNLSFEGIYNIITWPLIFLVAYNFRLAGKMNLNSNSYIVLLVLASYWLVYIYKNFQLNTIYYVYYAVVCIPFLFQLSHKKWSFCMNAGILLILVMSNKRGGLVAAVLGLFVFYLFKIHMEDKMKHKFKIILLILMLLIGAFYMINTYGLDFAIIRRFQRIFEDAGSGRISIWKSCISFINNSSFYDFIMGHGYKGVEKMLVSSSGAHNDFLEIMVDYGLLGLINTILFIGYVVKRFFLGLKYKMSSIPALAAMITIWLSLSVLSFIMWQSFIMNIISFYLACKMADINKQIG